MIGLYNILICSSIWKEFGCIVINDIEAVVAEEDDINHMCLFPQLIFGYFKRTNYTITYCAVI